MQQLFVHIPDSTRTDPIFSDITLPASNLHILYQTQHYEGQREVLSLVLRYGSKDNTIKEHFLQFHPVEKWTGQILGQQIVNHLSRLGLDIQKCRGQGYDGAAAMSSDRCGVQSVIREIVPSAVYVHCASHCLSLVIVNSCQRTSVKSSIDKISNVGSKFCVNHVKRFKQCCAYRFYLLVMKMRSTGVQSVC